MPSYPLDQIPALSFPAASTVDLTLTPASHGERVQGARLDPPSRGELRLDPNSGRLTFRPANGERGEFLLRLRGDQGGEFEVPIHLVPSLPSGFNVVGIGGTLPEPENPKYRLIEERPLGRALFNRTRDYGNPEEAQQETIGLSISAVKLILDPANQSYPLAPYRHQTHIRAYHFYADELVIRGRLSFPGAEVRIHARVLRLEDSGSEPAAIDTSAMVLTDLSRRHAAHQGEAAGDIYLYVQELQLPEGATPRFIAQGARGQAARRGEAAPKAGKVDIWDGRVETHDRLGINVTLAWDFDKEIAPVTGGRPVVCAEVIALHDGRSQGIVARMGSWDENGRPKPPGFPQDPTTYPGGPGFGGRGGDLYTSHQARVLPHVHLPQGAQGACAEDLPGAQPGSPSRSAWVKVYYDAYLFNLTRHREGESQLNRRGKVELEFAYDREPKLNVQAPRYPVTPITEPELRPRDGEVRPLPPGAHWCHPQLMLALSRYLHDAQLAGAGLAQLPRIDAYRDALASGGDLEQQAAHSELMSLVRRIEGPYDAFGKPAGWVPMLSFETSLKLYQQEIPSALRLFYLGFWLEQNQQRIADAGTALQKSLEATEAARDEAQRRHDSAQARLLELRPELHKLTAEGEALEAQVRSKIADLEREASGLTLEDALRGAGKLLGGVLQALPVGQPVTGLIGAATTLVADMDFDNPGSIVTDSVGFVLEQALDHAADAADKKIALFNQDPANAAPDEVTLTGAKKRLEERAKAGLATHKAAVASIHAGLGRFTVSDEVVHQRLNEALAADNRLETLRAEIERHNQTKAQLVEQLVTYSQAMEQGYSDYLAAELTLIELREALLRKLKRLNLPVLARLQGLTQRARERLLSYQYRLAKAASYQMVRPFALDVQAQFLVDAVMKMLQDDQQGRLDPSALDLLVAQFEASLKAITEPMLEHYSAHPLAVNDRVKVSLQPHQLAALNQPSGRVILDLAAMGALDEAVEDVRILDIRTASATVEGLPEHEAVNLHLEYRHSGLSRLRSGGIPYLFRAGEYQVEGAPESVPLLNDRMLWGTTVTYQRKSADRVETAYNPRMPSPTDSSWLRQLIGAGEQAQMALQYQPAAWGELRIQRSVTPNRYALKITELTLEFDLSVKGLAQGLTSISVQCRPGVVPLLLLDRADVSGRADGYGSFQRTFDSRTTGRVTLRAPRHFGALRFYGWLRVKGASEEELAKPFPLMAPALARLFAEHGNGAISFEPELTLGLGFHQVVIPVYGPAGLTTPL